MLAAYSKQRLPHLAHQQCSRLHFAMSRQPASGPIASLTCPALNSVLNAVALACCLFLLLLQASSAATAEDPTLDLSQLDVAAVMFDSAEPASFKHAVELVIGLSERAGESLPIVLIAAKDDLGMSNVSAATDALEACLLQCNSKV